MFTPSSIHIESGSQGTYCARPRRKQVRDELVEKKVEEEQGDAGSSMFSRIFTTFAEGVMEIVDPEDDHLDQDQRISIPDFEENIFDCGKSEMYCDSTISGMSFESLECAEWCSDDESEDTPVATIVGVVPVPPTKVQQNRQFSKAFDIAILAARKGLANLNTSI